jgi:hypothetical protein
MACFRYVTPVVKGRWRRSEEEALSDALEAGQAYTSGGRTVLFEFATIEREEPRLSCPEAEAKPSDLRSQALKCRRLAKSTSDDRTARTLNQMADEYEERARLVESRTDEPPMITVRPYDH